MPDRVRFILNGRPADVEIGPAERLIDILRGRLGLKGTRFGCGEEMCGACTVLVDGKPSYACTFEAVDVEGREVVTIEGIGTPEAPHPVQEAFLEKQAGQCGYCLSGIMVSATALIERNRQPTRDEIVVALDRHLCRCGAHNRIIEAVQRAAGLMVERDR